MCSLSVQRRSTLRDFVEYIPPVLVSGGLFLGMDIADWIKVMTLVYTIVGTICVIKRTFFSNRKGDKCV